MRVLVPSQPALWPWTSHHLCLSLNFPVCKVEELSQMISKSISNPKPRVLVTGTGALLSGTGRGWCLSSTCCMPGSTRPSLTCYLHVVLTAALLQRNSILTLQLEMPGLWEVAWTAGHSVEKGHSRDSSLGLTVLKHFPSIRLASFQ